MRGYAIEYCVQNCLRELPFVKGIYDIGLMDDKERGSLAFSAHEITLLDLTALETTSTWNAKGKQSQRMMESTMPLPY